MVLENDRGRHAIAIVTHYVAQHNSNLAISMQFSLRLLLAGVLLVGIVLGLFATQIRDAVTQRQERLLWNSWSAQVREAGAWLCWGYFDGESVLKVRLEGCSQPTGHTMMVIGKLPYEITYFEARDCLSLNDQTLQGFGKSDTLLKLELPGTGVGNNGLSFLHHYPKLRDLSLKRSRVDDRSVRMISKLPSLETLNLSDCRVSNQGVALLEGHDGLRQIDLSRTDVTAGVGESLLRIPTLQAANLWDTNVPDSEILDLVRELERRREVPEATASQ